MTRTFTVQLPEEDYLKLEAAAEIRLGTVEDLVRELAKGLGLLGDGPGFSDELCDCGHTAKDHEFSTTGHLGSSCTAEPDECFCSSFSQGHLTVYWLSFAMRNDPTSRNRLIDESRIEALHLETLDNVEQDWLYPSVDNERIESFIDTLERTTLDAEQLSALHPAASAVLRKLSSYLGRHAAAPFRDVPSDVLDSLDVLFDAVLTLGVCSLPERDGSVQHARWSLGWLWARLIVRDSSLP